MKVNTQSLKFKADQKLLDFIQARLDKLDQFYDHVISADVILKVENATDRENKIVEVRLNVPGNDLVVTKEAKSFEQATDLVAEALRRKLRKHKEKIRGI
jgi:putative sigma-54 modulation protein